MQGIECREKCVELASNRAEELLLSHHSDSGSLCLMRLNLRRSAQGRKGERERARRREAEAEAGAAPLSAERVRGGCAVPSAGGVDRRKAGRGKCDVVKLPVHARAGRRRPGWSLTGATLQLTTCLLYR